MSKSRTSQPQALLVPKPDFVSAIAKNGITAPVSHESSPLKPETPVDFDMLKGASPLARFGIDIGGTLCKVVYFEPSRQSCSFSVHFDESSMSMANELSSAVTKSLEVCENDFTKPFVGTTSVCNNLYEDVHLEPFSQEKEKSNLENGDSVVWPTTRREIPTDGHFEIKLGSDKVNNPSQNVDYLQSMVEEGGHRKNSREFINFNHIKASLDTLFGEQQKEGIHSPNYPMRHIRKIWLSSHAPIDLPGCGTLHFKCFETWRMDEFLKLTREYSLVTRGRAIGATGGGARKYFESFFEIAGLQLQHSDELKSLVRGIDFLVKKAQHESFEYPKGSYKAGRIQRPWKLFENGNDNDDSDSRRDKCRQRDDSDISITTKTEESINIDPKDAIDKCKGWETIKTMAIPRSPILERDGRCILSDGSQSLYPYLVVNIGSGVGILRVDSPDKFERVGGTSLGGSTFLGLALALTGCNSFEEVISLAMQGDSTQIDMLVGDIYGGDYTEMGLAATIVASSFGKLVDPSKRDAAMRTPEHLAKAVLLMITNNIGSIAMLHARAAVVDRVIFTGSFLHGNKIAIQLLAVAMEFWSKGLIKAIFLRHEGHAGAVGAMLYALDPTSKVDASLLV